MFRFRCWIWFVALIVLHNVWLQAKDDQSMVVHEWGTFTSLQGDDGNELFGINIDDEPVPKFVHNLEPRILNSPVLRSEAWDYRQKGAPRFHPQVSMRLETPVIYFYPAKETKLPVRVDVNVQFRGGWLTEFYPNADCDLLNKFNGQFDFSNLSSKTVGGLTWKNVDVGTHEEGPSTDWSVWLSPRKVASASLTCNGEHEKYLFYRGVGQLHSPLRITTIHEGADLEIRPNFEDVLHTETVAIKNLWLMEAKSDGSCAYRRIDPVTIDSNRDRLLVTTPRRFDAAQFQTNNRAVLEQEMHASLVAEGLFEDEATALLSTWQRAYFTSPGLRLFFTVPREWTDHYLPITISGNPKIERVMIGRVELISDYQRQTLRELSRIETFDARWTEKIPQDSSARTSFLAGRSNLSELGVKSPKDFTLYLELGRFRNALVSEAAQRGVGNLDKFIQAYGLQPYDVSSLSQ
jgi:hypothetical protein